MGIQLIEIWGELKNNRKFNSQLRVNLFLGQDQPNLFWAEFSSVIWVSLAHVFNNI
jgi:hypothetical protein